MKEDDPEAPLPLISASERKLVKQLAAQFERKLFREGDSVDPTPFLLKCPEHLWDHLLQEMTVSRLLRVLVSSMPEESQAKRVAKPKGKK